MFLVERESEIAEGRSEIWQCFTLTQGVNRKLAIDADLSGEHWDIYNLYLHFDNEQK